VSRRREVLRAVATVVVAALLLISLVWLATVRLTHDELEAAIKSAYRQNANLALAFEQHSLSTIQSVDHLLQDVIGSYGPRHLLDVGASERARAANSGTGKLVAVTDETGKVLAGEYALESRDLADREFFALHRDRDRGTVVVGVPLVGSMSGRVIIPLSRRMSFPDGTFAGVAVAGVDAVAFVANYHQMELGYSGMVLLVGLDGSTRVRRTGTYIAAGKAASADGLLKAQAGSDQGNFLSAGKREGTPRFTSYRTLREFGLVVAVGTAEADVYDGYAARRATFLTAASLFSAAVIVSAGLIQASMRGRRRLLVQALRNEAQFSATFHQAAIGIAHLTLDGRFLKVNEKLCRLIGYPAAKLLDIKLSDLKPPAERETSAAVIAEVVERGSLDTIERRYVRRDGSILWASISISQVRGLDGEPDYLVAMVQDIGERIAAHEKVLRRSQFDPLTDLPNRALFEDRLAQVLLQARRRHGIAAVMFIDLDGFKAVNDTRGHGAGDELLREVGRRLAATIRTGDTAARVGGDEFAVVLAHLAEAGDAATVARKILDALAVAFTIEGTVLTVGASIGIALFPAHGEEGADLVRKADRAMFEAKQAGKNAFRVYDPARAILAA
jgi:diguanylate cyclase (GGDEF)-like protein/PAS domain S-box-containing protein